MANTNETKVQVNSQSILQNGQSDSAMPVTPHPLVRPVKHLNRGMIWLFVAVLIIVALSLLAFINHQNNSLQAPVPTTVKSYEPTVDSTKAVLKKQEKLVFPVVVTSNNIDSNQLPENFKNFIVDGAKEVNVHSVVYDKESKGYNISYNATQPIADLFQLLNRIPVSNSVLLDGSRGNKAAVFEKRNLQYSIRVAIEFLDENYSKVTVDILGN